MLVNVSRSKALINGTNAIRKSKRDVAPSVRCNHCGGPIRPNGEIQTCLMCSREDGHVCSNCSHVRSVEIANSKKKSA